MYRLFQMHARFTARLFLKMLRHKCIWYIGSLQNRCADQITSICSYSYAVHLITNVVPMKLICLWIDLDELAENSVLIVLHSLLLNIRGFSGIVYMNASK